MIDFKEMSIAQSLAANFIAEHGACDALPAATNMLRSQTKEDQKEFWEEVIFNIKILSSIQPQSS